MRLKYDKLSCKKKRYYMSILEMAEKHTGNWSWTLSLDFVESKRRIGRSFLRGHAHMSKLVLEPSCQEPAKLS
jgi:hypothetical protein